MITTPGPTRQAVPRPTYEVVRRHLRTDGWNNGIPQPPGDLNKLRIWVMHPAKSEVLKPHRLRRWDRELRAFLTA